MTEQVLSMDEPKQRLANLNEHLSGVSPEMFKYVCDFGRFLAGNSYLDGDIKLEYLPSVFVRQCDLALYDLQMGVSGLWNTRGQLIQNRLTGLSEVFYLLLHMQIPHIADAVLPAELAAHVKNKIEWLNTEMQKERATK
ncbi:MAG TPA: hypothetical protein VJC15_03430 [Candidatus Paceibacterota bacterium]